MPDLAIGIYDWAVVVDHAERRTWLVGHGRDERTFAAGRSSSRACRPSRRPNARRSRTRPSESNLDRSAYAAAFRAVQEHIRGGDCYQVNLAQRFEATAAGDPWLAYQRLRVINPAPFSAYLDTPDGTIVCFAGALPASARRSRRDQADQGHAAARATPGSMTARIAEELRTSDKDRAENVMIVDLLRNDLSKSCRLGSVKVPKLFDVESFATRASPREHRRRAARARTRRARSPARRVSRAARSRARRSSRAMEIIEELEPHRRGVYCGAIGYIGFDGNMDLNIAIRTLVQQGERVYTWAGGGIVADSNLEAEYQETFDKAAAMLAVMDSAAD